MNMQVEVICYEKWGDEFFAQARFLVHGFEDVLWTNDYEEAAKFIRQELKKWESQHESSH